MVGWKSFELGVSHFGELTFKCLELIGRFAFMYGIVQCIILLAVYLKASSFNLAAFAATRLKVHVDARNLAVSLHAFGDADFILACRDAVDCRFGGVTHLHVVDREMTIDRLVLDSDTLNSDFHNELRVNKLTF